MKKIACLMIVLCLCLSAALCEDEAIWQLAQDVLAPAEITWSEYGPVYPASVIADLMTAAKERGVDTDEFAWLADADVVDCTTAYDALAIAAFGNWSVMSLEDQYHVRELLFQLGLTDVNLSGLPDETDMSVSEAHAHAAKLLYWNYGLMLPEDNDGVYVYATQFVFSGLNEDDYCWDILVLNNDDDIAYSVIFDRQGKLLYAANGEGLMDDEQTYIHRMPLAYLSLAEQQLLLGDENCPLGNYRTVPQPGEPTADDVIAMAIDDVVNGRGIDMRANPITGEDVSALIDRLQIGVTCCRWNVDEDTPVMNWDVYMTNDPYAPTEGYRISYIYDCATQQFDEAWIHDITDCSNG